MKALLYCTKKEPIVVPINFNNGWFYREIFEFTHYANGSTYNMGNSINGTICAICDIDEITEIKGKPIPTFDNANIESQYVFEDKNLLKKCALTYDELCEYGEGKTLYGLNLSNVCLLSSNDKTNIKTLNIGILKDLKARFDDNIEKNIRSMVCGYSPNTLKITDLINLNGKPLKNAPQSWCYSKFNDEIVLVISIRSHWMEKILNGTKTIELRKTKPIIDKIDFWKKGEIVEVWSKENGIDSLKYIAEIANVNIDGSFSTWYIETPFDVSGKPIKPKEKSLYYTIKKASLENKEFAYIHNTIKRCQELNLIKINTEEAKKINNFFDELKLHENKTGCFIRKDDM